MIVEAHQEDILQPTHITIPNTPEAERMVGMMNKNLPAFLWHMLIEQGLPEDFITGLLNKSCKATMLAEATKCKWDSNSRTLTTENKMNREEETRAFKGASWFKDEFGLLAKGSKQKNTPHQRPCSTRMAVDQSKQFTTIIRSQSCRRVCHSVSRRRRR